MVTPRRSRESTPRNTTFRRRVRTMMNDGFTQGEAEWAADNKLHMANRTVRRVRRARVAFIDLYQQLFPNATREIAIATASQAAQGRARRDGLSREDINNIFKQISP